MSSIDSQTHPLSSDGGIELRPTEVRDPFVVFNELMQVIEALCPTYPARDILIVPPITLESDDSRWEL
jgi:hypothetical protein